MNWKKYIIALAKTPSCVLCQFLWHNSYINIDNKAVYLKFFSTNSINFITQLFHSDGSAKNWNILKSEYVLQNSLLVVKVHHLLRASRVLILEKLSSKELYQLLISAIDHQSTSQKYLGTFFLNIELPWKEIYLTASKVTANSHLRCFHYKIINNVFYLNKNFFQFDKTQCR